MAFFIKIINYSKVYVLIWATNCINGKLNLKMLGTADQKAWKKDETGT
jgi:hypothetical protein